MEITTKQPVPFTLCVTTDEITNAILKLYNRKEEILEKSNENPLPAGDVIELEFLSHAMETLLDLNTQAKHRQLVHDDGSNVNTDYAHNILYIVEKMFTSFKAFGLYACLTAVRVTAKQVELDSTFQKYGNSMGNLVALVKQSAASYKEDMGRFLMNLYADRDQYSRGKIIELIREKIETGTSELERDGE